MRTRTLSRLAVATALVLGLAACGDDDDTATDTGAGDPGAGGDIYSEPGGGAAGGGDDEGGDDGGDGGAAPAGDGVTISNFAFVPSELTVASGGAIPVSNEDGFAHTFTSEDAGFDLELGSGESGEVTVDADPGEYEFLCTIHPTMRGTLTVE